MARFDPVSTSAIWLMRLKLPQASGSQKKAYYIQNKLPACMSVLQPLGPPFWVGTQNSAVLSREFMASWIQILWVERGPNPIFNCPSNYVSLQEMHLEFTPRLAGGQLLLFLWLVRFIPSEIKSENKRPLHFWHIQMSEARKNPLLCQRHIAQSHPLSLLTLDGFSIKS